MVKLKEKSHIADDGSIRWDTWLHECATKHHRDDLALIRQACLLSQFTQEISQPSLSEGCMQQGLAMAEILLDLNLDSETIAAAIVFASIQNADLPLEDVAEQLGSNVAKLIRGVEQMDAMRSLHSHPSRSQVENLRKMLLAMAEDMRVVLIKLAEQTWRLRSAERLDNASQVLLAKESLDIYAPLANRLGIGQIKWELEDLAFRYLEPAIYKNLAKLLDQKRLDREHYIQNVMQHLRQALQQAGIASAEVQGRAKHIYSIYRKMLRKGVDYNQIYDISAVRILVPSVEDCYAALSVVHSLWEQIPNEFDDYITMPKENGYRSIHTAVKGPHGKNVEVQIRTHEMHHESELGIAAHWRYKEDKQQSSYDDKIIWLRQVLAWQKEWAIAKEPGNKPSEIFSDRIYVFTPNGEIVDLPKGATPLDFAYHIHSELGHCCKGAKVNGTIVPLTYKLNTGERIEILTHKHPNPSRDWLNSQLGYLKTSRAKAKVHHWFKMQDQEHYINDGQALLDKELKRLEISSLNLNQIADKLRLKSAKDVLAGLGNGDLRLAQITNLLQSQIESMHANNFAVVSSPTHKKASKGVKVEGVENLLTHTARCCTPVPGDAIIGYITQGRGVSIHKHDCRNVKQISEQNHKKLIPVYWEEMSESTYPVAIAILAHDRQGLVKDIGTVFANEKINVIALNSATNQSRNIAHLIVTAEVKSLDSLQKVIDKLSLLPKVISAKRYKPGG